MDWFEFRSARHLVSSRSVAHRLKASAGFPGLWQFPVSSALGTRFSPKFKEFCNGQGHTTPFAFGVVFEWNTMINEESKVSDYLIFLRGRFSFGI